jgi:hypothetical protein
MSWRAGDRAAAAERLDQAVAHLERSLAQAGADESFLMDSLLEARFLAWQQRGVDLLEEERFAGLVTATPGVGESCTTHANRVRQAILSGDTEKARELTAKLLGGGYYEPGFIRTCRQYELCQGGG